LANRKKVVWPKLLVKRNVVLKIKTTHFKFQRKISHLFWFWWQRLH